MARKNHENDCRSSCASNNECVAYNVDDWGCCYKYENTPHPFTSGTQFYIKKSTAPIGSYVSSLCTPGSSKEEGSDLKLSPCTNEVPLGSFVADTCVKGSPNGLGTDTLIIPCTTANGVPGESYGVQCVAGNFKEKGIDSAVYSCSMPKDGDYVA